MTKLNETNDFVKNWTDVNNRYNIRYSPSFGQKCVCDAIWSCKNLWVTFCNFPDPIVLVDFENGTFGHKQMLLGKISFLLEIAVYMYGLMPYEYEIRFNDIKYHPYMCVTYLSSSVRSNLFSLIRWSFLPKAHPHQWLFLHLTVYQDNTTDDCKVSLNAHCLVQKSLA